MTLQDVERALAEIREHVYDDECAHGQEDALYRAVLQAIADGTCESPADCARLALTSQAEDFERWCA